MISLLRTLVTILILSFLTYTSWSQELDSLKEKIDSIIVEEKTSDNPYEVKLNKQYLKSYWYDTKAVLLSPFHWKPKDFVLATGALAITSGLYSADQELKDWSQERKTRDSKKFVSIFEPLGNGRYLMITSGAVYLGGVIFKSPRAKKAALLVLESQLINGILGQSVKLITSRRRPRDGARYDEWEGPNLSPSTSFPSGHAQTVFALSTAIATVYADKKWLPPIAYGIATITAVSRVHDNAHWASDVFMGSVLGFFMTKTIVNRHVNKENPKLSVLPFYIGNNSGVKLTYVLD